MVFTPEAVRRIAQGKQTMTRRLVKSSSCPQKVGRVYQAQPGWARKGIHHITITDVCRERLGDISLPDARREGFRTRADFFEDWAKQRTLDHDEMVWVISFVLGDQADRPRLLAKRPAAPDGDYVREPYRAMRNEPEAVSAQEQERQTHRAADRAGREDEFRREHLARIAEMSLGDRLARLEAEQRRHGVDLSSEMRRIRQELGGE